MLSSAEFIEEVLQLQGTPQQAWDNPYVRMGTIDPTYTGVGLPCVRFDGEMTVSLTGYRFVPYYSPQPNERVVLLRISTSWLIIGSPASNYRSYRVLNDLSELPLAPRDGDLVRIDKYGWWEYDALTETWDYMKPWGASWGKILTLFDAGGETSASTTMVTLWQSSDFVAINGRSYGISVHQNWRGSTADNIIDYDLLVNHNGVDTLLRTFREVNALSTASNASETVTEFVTWDCGADDPTCYIWARASRLSGAGTITMGSAVASLYDMGRA